MAKTFEWDADKNQKLKRERGLSFEAVVSRIEEGAILALAQGTGKFSHQIHYVIEFNGYAFIVPAVEDERKIFLKTIIPSRKMTKFFLMGEQP